MTKRLNFLASKNGGIEGLVAVETWIEKSFDPKLLELIRVRVSQMNGCAHCLHMHRQDALKLGETEDRLLLLNAWHESQLYTTQSGNEPRSPGPSPSPKLRRATRRTRSTKRRRAPSPTTSSSHSQSGWP
jgi:AhpD family alkylhydroperoxidase